MGGRINMFMIGAKLFCGCVQMCNGGVWMCRWANVLVGWMVLGCVHHLLCECAHVVSGWMVLGCVDEGMVGGEMCRRLNLFIFGCNMCWMCGLMNVDVSMC
jgi:hypothetical protein